MRQILLIALTAAALLGADATGTWNGSLITPSDDGGEKEGPALVVLKQNGSSLTGTAGPSEDEQHTISNGKAENGTLTFELVRGGGGVMKFSLKHEGDEIKGTVTREREGQTQTAKLMLKRSK